MTNAEDAAWVSEADLPKTERVQQLLESVRRYEPGLSEEHGLKDSWQYRGMLLIALKELETLARW